MSFAFVTCMEMLSEKANLHHEWSNIWNSLCVVLSTNDWENLVTEKDHGLAENKDRVAGT